jgi:hypothetical protein
MRPLLNTSAFHIFRILPTSFIPPPHTLLTRSLYLIPSSLSPFFFKLSSQKFPVCSRLPFDIIVWKSLSGTFESLSFHNCLVPWRVLIFGLSGDFQRLYDNFYQMFNHTAHGSIDERAKTLIHFIHSAAYWRKCPVLHEVENRVVQQ